MNESGSGTVVNQSVDNYFREGCGRCPRGGSPECSVQRWQPELQKLRAIVLEAGLCEERKWGVPCYTFDGKNIVIIHAFREYCSLMFFKGAMLNDMERVLVQQTENVQGARQIRFTAPAQVIEKESLLKAYIAEAVALEKQGAKLVYKDTTAFAFPDELKQRLESQPALKAAFEALSPGRQRGYLLHFSAPKQSSTRAARIDKCTAKILTGKGLQD